ncbi:MAG TPA: CBS domain-containing protein [Candidatus Nitrosotenuis sp.]|nr:CBS domain-containing protein [Candidatus Nitrosotenuis sp.]
MLPRIDSIKQARIKIGVTQKELAKMSGVSTSMINQIESGRSQPSYETAKRIFDSLATLEGRTDPNKAGDICSKEIVKLKPTDSLHDAIHKMRVMSISQIPIFSSSEPVGSISEDGVVRHLADSDESSWKKIKLADVMEARPPIVDYQTPARALVTLIRYSKSILVAKSGKIIGIITASDTLKMLE